MSSAILDGDCSADVYVDFCPEAVTPLAVAVVNVDERGPGKPHGAAWSGVGSGRVGNSALASWTSHAAAAPAIDVARKNGRVSTSGRADLIEAIRNLGPDHPHTLTVRKNAALALVEAGQTDEAIRQYEILTAECARVLGPQHRHTLTARASLARLCA